MPFKCVFVCIFIFIGFPSVLGHYADRVRSRLYSAYRPSTLGAQKNAVSALAIFCLYYALQFPLITLHVLLSFIEFLLDSSLSVPTIKNYISAIKSSFKLHNVPIQPFLSPQLTLTLASLNKNWVPNLSLKPVISPFQLTKIIAYASFLSIQFTMWLTYLVLWQCCPFQI
jgi:hypothetical protein